MTHAKEEKVNAIWFKSKRVWRTAFAYALGGLSVLPIALGIVQEYYPSSTITWLVAQLGAVQLIVTRVMAIEKVNAWLSLVGLGSAPRAVLEATQRAE